MKGGYEDGWERPWTTPLAAGQLPGEPLVVPAPPNDNSGTCPVCGGAHGFSALMDCPALSGVIRHMDGSMTLQFKDRSSVDRANKAMNYAVGLMLGALCGTVVLGGIALGYWMIVQFR